MAFAMTRLLDNRVTCGRPGCTFGGWVQRSPQPIVDMKRNAASLAFGAIPSDSNASPGTGKDLQPAPKRSRPTASPPNAISQQQGPPAAKKARPAAAAALPKPAVGLWLVVGLGNPGANYENTRHNVGFMVIDELARAHGIDCRKLEKSAAVGKGMIEKQQVLLVKPVTFMNNSGESVSALAKFYKVPTQNILVISDDLDLPHAALRMRSKGGHGGHNGLRSISERMGNTQDFPRIKIGIGRPTGPTPIHAWVLQDFTRKEMETMQITIQETCDAVRSIMALGMEKALSGVRATEVPTSKAKPAAATAAAAAGAGSAPGVQQKQAGPLQAPGAAGQPRQIASETPAVLK